MPRPLQELYDDALQVVRNQSNHIQNLEARIAELEDEVSDLEDEVETLEKEAENSDLYGDDDDDEFEVLDYDPVALFTFVKEIGFDPYNLPSSLGECLAIRDLLQAARKVR